MEHRALICHHCKKEFIAKHKDAMFCSRKCDYQNFKENNPHYDKDYRDKNRETINEKMRVFNKIWRKNNPNRWKAIKKNQNLKYQEKYPEKRKVQINGWKLKSDLCSNCGKNQNLEFHHTDYKKNIGITLCFDCHRNLHKHQKKGGIIIWQRV